MMMKVINNWCLVPTSEFTARPGVWGAGLGLEPQTCENQNVLPALLFAVWFPAAIKQKLRLLLFVIRGTSR